MEKKGEVRYFEEGSYIIELPFLLMEVVTK